MRMQQTNSIAELLTMRFIQPEIPQDVVEGLLEDTKPRIAILLQMHKGVFQTLL